MAKVIGCFLGLLKLLIGELAVYVTHVPKSGVETCVGLESPYLSRVKCT